MQIQRTGRLGMGATQNRAIGTLQRTNRQLRKILEKLSTGLRINRASDDAAGLSISENLRTQVRGFKAATLNVNDAMSALHIAEGAGREIGDMLQRQRELALQASSDTLSDEQRSMLDGEYQNLTQEINRIAESTTFATQNVANGTGLGAGGAQIQAGPNTGDIIDMPGIDMTVDALGLTGTSIANAASAELALSGIDSAMNTLNAGRSSIGATINKFESTIENLEVSEINTQAAESVLRDQDMATAVMDLTRERILMESGTQAFSRFNDISASHIFSLLQ